MPALRRNRRVSIVCPSRYCAAFRTIRKVASIPQPGIRAYGSEEGSCFMKRGFAAIACAIAFALASSAGTAQTLNTIKTRGNLNCGSNTGMAGYGVADRQGNWTGFDVDFCRALAAAIFNDPTKVKFIPTTGQNRFTALQSGDVDVLNSNTTWTSSRDTSLGLNFTGTSYFDGQGFIVRKSLKVASALELNDAAVCVSQGSTTELNLADYFRANKMKL